MVADGITILNRVSIITPIVLITILTSGEKGNDRKNIKRVGKGILLSALVMIVIYATNLLVTGLIGHHLSESKDIICTNFSLPTEIKPWKIFDGRHASKFLGFDIYQFYVSLGTVVSLTIGITLQLSNILEETDTNKAFTNKKINKWLKIIFISSALLGIVLMRKIIVVDMVCYGVIGYIGLARFGKTRKINYIKPLIYWLIGIGIMALNTRSTVQLTIESIGADRADTIRETLTILANSANTFLFTGLDKGGFGGYSNTFIEVLARNGLLKMITFAGMASFFIAKPLKYIGRKEGGNRNIETSFWCIAWIIGTNIVISNAINMSLSQPYYYCFLTIVLSIAYELKSDYGP